MATTDTLRATMTAIAIEAPGDSSVLVPQSRPMPEPGPGEVLIDVAAAGINRPDIMQRQGLYPAPRGVTDIPGLEVAGTICALGPDVERWQIGDTVCALVAGGGYASHCLAPGVQCLPIPQGLSLTEAAALPETFFTVWSNIKDRAGLSEGEVFLVHGGAGGIGTTAIQIASNLGARVFATAGSAEKCRVCTELGAAQAIDYTNEDFVEVVKQRTDKHGADVILDMVGGDYIARNIRCLAKEGRLVNIAYQRGSKADIDFLPVMLKRLTLTGATLRIRETSYKARIAQELERTVWPWLAGKKVRPVIHACFPLHEAALAHDAMETGDHIGKIVLTGAGA